jgi:hypothetical protein
MQLACDQEFSLAEVTPDKVVALQDELLKLPQADIVTKHTFFDGVYERTITIPPWTVLTGAAHKTPYKVRLDKGTIAVNTDDGVKVLTAPCAFDAPAGMQRAGRVFDDEVVWTDIYPNPDNCTDIGVVEERLYEIPACGLADSRTAVQKAQVDYGAFLHQMGMTQAEMDKIVQIESDQIEMPAEYFVEVKDSPIHGKGLFATKAFAAGEVVCAGRLNGKRTPGGRYTNHSLHANVEPKKDGDDIYAVALRTIPVGAELLVDYRASMRVNFGLALQGELPCLDG